MNSEKAQHDGRGASRLSHSRRRHRICRSMHFKVLIQDSPTPQVKLLEAPFWNEWLPAKLERPDHGRRRALRPGRHPG